ncbi:zinc-ribbon domain-containing protein [Veillonella intestinalis]|uniref:zinc-ribbon domain-containing protein n=1 Tax=Veillonella intestinalis TaxID=2941341 RepID=UPI0020417C07|nr:DUF805 domain-containing protein [Veillonella intestinalis]
MEKFCSNCGKLLDKDAKFCGACGKSLKRNSVDVVMNTIDSNVEKLEKNSAEVIKNKVIPTLDKVGAKIHEDFWEPKLNSEEQVFIEDKGFIDSFFKKDGRLNRKPYIFRLVTIHLSRFVFMLTLWYLLSDDYGNVSSPIEWLLIALAMCFVYSNYCINVRRQQDLATFDEDVEANSEDNDKDDKFFLSKAIVFLEFMALLSVFNDGHTLRGTTKLYKDLEPLFIIGAYFFLLYLSTKRGTKGRNQYGPDPLEHK